MLVVLNFSDKAVRFKAPEGFDADDALLLLGDTRIWGVIGNNPQLRALRTLDVAESTIKVHVQNILRKLGLQSRVQAAVYAVEHGFDKTDRGG